MNVISSEFDTKDATKARVGNASGPEAKLMSPWKYDIHKQQFLIPEYS